MKKLCLTLTISALAFTARANTIVYNTLGPGDSFSSVAFFGVLNSVFTSYVGARFTAKASGNLATVEFAMSDFDPFSFPVPAVDVYLYGDAGSSPNIADQTLLGTQMILTFPGFPILFDLNVTGTVPVTAGSAYWLVLKPAVPDEHLDWSFSLPEVPGLVDFTSNGSTWFPDTDNDPLPAFRITATSTVPDPASTATLMLVSLAAMEAMRKVHAIKRGISDNH